MDIAADIERLYRDRRNLVREALSKFEDNQDRLDDLEGDVWLAVWEAKDTFNGTAELTTWITGIAKNVGRNHIRGIIRTPDVAFGEEVKDDELDESWLDQLVTSQDDPAVTVTMELDLEVLWGLLTEAQRSVLEHRVRGMDYDEIAEVTNLSPKAIRTHMMRARRVFADYVRGDI